MRHVFLSLILLLAAATGAQDTFSIVAVDVAIGHQRATMRAAPVQHADLIVETRHDKIDVGHERVQDLSVKAVE